MMKLKFMAFGIALLFVLTLVPMGAQAGYSLAISGAGEFTATPFQAKVFNTTDVYVRVFLSDTSPSSMSISMEADGDLAQYISFPEYTGTPTFTLFPGQNQKVLYIIDMPASMPGKYTGAIQAIGTPPVTESDNATGAIGKPVVAINIVVDVPTEIQIFDFQTSRPGGYPDRDWAVWGDDWATDMSIVNGGNSTFNGYCNLTFSDSAGVLESDSFNITNLSVAGTFTRTISWSDGLSLNENYEIKAVIYSDTGEKMDEEFLIFHIPSPADIISVSQNPETVFWGETAAIYAIAASSDSTLTLHYLVNNGTDNTTQMTYSSTTGEYSATIPNQDIGSTVFYWVSSVNDIHSDRSPYGTGAYSYYVFSPDVPDLTINEETIQFIPVDPRTENVNVSDGDGNPAQITMFFTIGNIGRGDVSSIPFAIYDGEIEIWSGTVASIAGQSNSDFLQFTWNPTEGEHILRFVVDPDDTILELDENNNHYTIDAFTIHAPEPYVPPDGEDPPADPTSILPYIIIPIILFLIIFFFLFLRKKTINVTISEVKPFKHPKKGTMLWRYTCSYADGIILGPTSSSETHAEVGTVIQVQPYGLHARDNGTIGWGNAEVIKVLEDGKPDEEKDIRKLIKKEGK